VFFLLLIISAGLFGSQVPIRNLAPTSIWVIWWVGFGLIHAFVGNIWALVNPWKTIYGGVTRLIRGGEEREPLLRYPTKFGALPAFILFFAFVWTELVYPKAAEPVSIALFMVAYSIITLVGMFLFGRHVWLRFGEAFSVFFRFLSMLGPTEVRIRDKEVCRRCTSECLTNDEDCVNCYECYSKSGQREINIRPFAFGLLSQEKLGLDGVAFIVLMLSSVTFDGVLRTYAWFNLIGMDPFVARDILVQINTIGLLGSFLLFLGIYTAFISLVKLFSGSQVSVNRLALVFVFSLLPIAMVYQFAHYSTYLVINGLQIIRLVSDPFGFQWDLFGTRNIALNTALDYFAVWHYQVALIVIGHVIAVYIAHIISLRTFTEHRDAVRSQYPMMALMVMYTIIGLWLLSAPSAG
jgi:hypothetical protein